LVWGCFTLNVNGTDYTAALFILSLPQLIHPAAQETAPILSFDVIKRIGTVVWMQVKALPRQQLLSEELRHPPARTSGLTSQQRATSTIQRGSKVS
jgi:hypothetical protein